MGNLNQFDDINLWTNLTEWRTCLIDSDLDKTSIHDFEVYVVQEVLFYGLDKITVTE